jgi:response regulator NasT
MTSVRLLLVDDDRLILATLGKNLREAGYEVELADSGAAALELAVRSPFHLAILDMRMPGLSGTETAMALRDRHGIPALFLSAYGEVEQVRQAVAEGGLGYVVKPADAPQLIPAIEAALARARDLNSLFQAKAQLERALAGGRQTSIAIGILMERRGLSEPKAFAALRAAARRRQIKLDEHCAGLVAALELVNGD